MSELTEHGRKALERCIREHQKFIELADDYDLDEMSVQALKTAIESMQMRLDANAKPAAGPSEHDESWAEMMEHDYDTAVRGAVISNTVEFTDSCGCVFCDLKCHHSIEDCKLIALLEDVAVQHEGLENYGDSCGPSMCIRACRGAIAALKATHPQPVTPAMVERLSATVDRIEELNARQDERGRKLDSAVTPVVDGESFICYLIDNCEREVIHEESLHEWLADFLKNPRYHKPVTPAGGEVDCGCGWGSDCEDAVIDRRLNSLHKDMRANGHNGGMVGVAWDRAVFRAGMENYPPVADAALVRDAERYRHLRDAHSEKWTDAATGTTPTCSIDFAWRGHDIDAAVDESMQDAALNQRGGG